MRIRRHRLHILLLVIAGLLAVDLAEWYAAFYVEHHQRDYSAIPDAELRVGFCIISTLTRAQKAVIAQSVRREPDPELFGAVMPLALSGEASAEKKEMLHALRERDTLRTQARDLVRKAADECDYDRSRIAANTTPWNIALKWLAYDREFQEMVRAEWKHPPDAAEAAYRAGRASPR